MGRRVPSRAEDEGKLSSASVARCAYAGQRGVWERGEAYGKEVRLVTREHRETRELKRQRADLREGRHAALRARSVEPHCVPSDGET